MKVARRRCFLFLLLSLAAGAVCSATSEQYLSDEAVSVQFVDDTYRGNLTFEVAVPPALALEVLTDFERMVDFVPNLQVSRILGREGNVFLIAQQGKAQFGPFSFKFESERRVELFADGRLVSQAISGSTKKMLSEVRTLKTRGGTRIDYQIEMIPGRWLPSTFGVSFMRHELAEQFSALAGEMLRRQQQRALK